MSSRKKEKVSQETHPYREAITSRSAMSHDMFGVIPRYDIPEDHTDKTRPVSLRMTGFGRVASWNGKEPETRQYREVVENQSAWFLGNGFSVWMSSRCNYLCHNYLFKNS